LAMFLMTSASTFDALKMNRSLSTALVNGRGV
jgi:hypothetical protein